MYPLQGLLFRALADLVEDLVVVREAVRRLVGIHFLPVDEHFKDPAFTLFQVGGYPELVFYRGLQTGGLREIVSLSAIRDLDLHSLSSPPEEKLITYSSYWPRE